MRNSGGSAGIGRWTARSRFQLHRVHLVDQGGVVGELGARRKPLWCKNPEGFFLVSCSIMARTWRWRLQRIPRKLKHAWEWTSWFYQDVCNGLRILMEIRLQKKPIIDLTRYERRIYSQHGEDGILEAIFTAIGTTNKYFVEFGSGNLHECNTVVLARWGGWRGLWMDGQYIDQRGRVQHEWITAENIEALFEKYEVPPTFDLFSIDIDGNDYWVWKAITAYRPRVVVIEYNAAVPTDKSQAVPYDPAFLWDLRTSYYGASLLALQRLGEQKGYMLVGCGSSGTNAFFVQRDLLRGRFAVRDVTSIYRPSQVYDGRGFPPDPSHTMIEV